MTALSQELPKNYPGSVEISVAGFHAALVAIGREMHQKTQAGHQSLWAWWQWLDDESYERQAFAEVLCQVGRTTIGEEAFTELTAYSKSIENDPDGIATLIEYVNKHYPDLAQEITKIEKLAEEEENQIQDIAGGISEGAKDALRGVVVAGGVAAIGWGGYELGHGIHAWYQRRGAESATRLAENAERNLENRAQGGIDAIEELANRVGREAAPRAERVVEQNVREGLGLREQERAASEKLAEAVEKETGNARDILQFKLKNELEDLSTVAKEERAGAIERITAKFMPSKGQIENYTLERINRKDIRGEIIDHAKEHGFEDDMLGLATRAELRKDRKALGQIVDAELKPELEKVFSDSEIDNLYDLDKLVVNKLLGEDPSKIREQLQFWGSKESIFAKGFELRHPSVKVGLREYIRDVAMNSMTTFNKEQALENLKMHEYGGVEKYLKSDVYEKMTKEAKRQAIKEERLIREKTDFKQELKEYLNKDKATIEKEIKENLDSEAQVVEEKEVEEAKNTLNAIEKSEKESISVEITSEVDDVIIETKQVTRAAEKKAEKSLDII